MKKDEPKTAPVQKGIFATRRVCFEKHVTDTKLPVPVMTSNGLVTALKEQKCPACEGPTIGVALFREVDEPDEILISTEALLAVMKPVDRFSRPDGEMVQEYHAILK